MKGSQRIGLWMLVVAEIGLGIWGVKAWDTKTSMGLKPQTVIPSDHSEADDVNPDGQDSISPDGFHTVESIVGMTGRGALFACLKGEIKKDLRLDQATFDELWDAKQIYHVDLGHQSEAQLRSQLGQTIVYFPYLEERHLGSELFLIESLPWGDEMKLDDVILDTDLKYSITSVEEKGDQLRIKSTDGNQARSTLLRWDGKLFHVMVPPEKG